MKKVVLKITYVVITLVVFLNLSGCAKVQDPSGKIYPINNDWFWDRVFVSPIAWLMDFFTRNTGGAFALGIVFATIVVRTILFPIYTKSNDTSVKMQAIQPEIKKIQAKYAGKTDPESRNRQQMELMKVYKDNNVNMFAGCLMPFLQMPVFLAMYNAVVKVPFTFKYTDANLSFLWLNKNVQTGDTVLFGLAARDPYYILPILVAATALLLQYISMMGLSPEARNNPTMKMMTWMMPGMMLLFSFSQASALSLYWVVGNIYSTLQIIFVKRPFKIDFKNFKIIKK